MSASTNTATLTLADLAPAKRWCAWQEQLGQTTGKPTKVPYGPYGPIDVTNLANWLTRAEAAQVAAKLHGTLKGVALCLGPGPGIPKGYGLGGYDLDTCREPRTEICTPWAREAMDRLDTCAEVSPSETGVKGFFLYRLAELDVISTVLGRNPGALGGTLWKEATGQDHPPGIEVYLGKRYFAVTDDSEPFLPSVLRVLDVGDFQALADIAKALTDAGNGLDKPPDGTRSAEAMRIGRRCRVAGQTYQEMCEAIQNDPVTGSWYHEKGLASGERELKRCWHKTKVPPEAVIIAAKVREAGGGYDDFLARVGQDPATREWFTYTDKAEHREAWGQFDVEDGPEPAGPTPTPAPQAPWPTFDLKALHGLSGAVVRAWMPHTEADPAALQLQLLASFGNAAGRHAHYMVNYSPLFTNLDVLLAGGTSDGGKGMSASDVAVLMRKADPNWADNCQGSGLSSGEGVFAEIHDDIYAWDRKKQQNVLVEPGKPDKRLYILETEFQGALTVMKRDGNILSRILRDAWDSRPVLRSMVKSSKMRATDSHISLTGHITPYELRAELSQTSLFNGFINRHLCCCCRRTQDLPFGGNLDPQLLDQLAQQVADALQFARGAGRMDWSPAARPLWDRLYRGPLKMKAAGLLDGIINRARTQVVKLAMIYALFDKSLVIDVAHLEAAAAMWDYCKQSVVYLFGDMTGDTLADEILRLLHVNGEMTRTEIANRFSHSRDAARFDRALAMLEERGLIICTQKRGFGQPEKWKAI
jgi:hypothetical protein